MNTTYLIIGSLVVIIVLALVYFRQPVTDQEAVYKDWEVWEDDAPEPEIRQPSARFEGGGYYRWEPIEDLLWAYGYTWQEVHEAWNHNYIEIYRDGLHAEFDGSLFVTDRQGNQLYACHLFDTEAQTEQSDRWRRQPTDDERRQAVWQ